MKLNEMEKRLLFQVEGDYQSKILNELNMTAWYTKILNNERQRKINGKAAHPDGCRVHGYRMGYSEELPSAQLTPDNWGKDCKGSNPT